MASISDIMTALVPALDEVSKRDKSGQATQLDQRICDLARKICSVRNVHGSSDFGNFEVVNVHLSNTLTLADFKTSLECSPEAANRIVTYLNLQQNFDKVNQQFQVLERIQAVSERVLEHVSLFDLQLTGFVIDMDHSPVWYALASEDQFLSRQVLDLKKFKINTHVAAARINDIEVGSAHLLQGLKNESFTPSGFFGTLSLSIGKLRLLSGGDLNNIAKRIPSSACVLFSDDQVRSVDFHKFSGKQLDKMIGGDETDEEVSRRFGILNPDQIETFLKKSSGCHFSKFSDLFYAALPFSRLNKDQVKALFDDDYGLQKEKAQHHLQLVSSQEISKGLHLLSDDHLRMISKNQISSLDYSQITTKQLDGIFTSYTFSDQEKAERVSLIPVRFVNDVLRVSSDIVKYLSQNQCQILNPDLLDQKAVHSLFPGFSIDAIHPGYEHTVQERMGKVQHKFERREEGFSSMSTSMSSYSQSDLDTMIERRKEQCMFWAQRFSTQQLKIMTPVMYPEVQELLSGLSGLANVRKRKR